MKEFIDESKHEDFFAAVEAGDLSGAQAMLAADPDLVDARDKGGATALHLAAFHAHRHRALISALALKRSSSLLRNVFSTGSTPAS